MNYFLIILSFISLSFCQFLPNDNDLMNMSYEEKIMVYYGEKKSPTGAILQEIFIPTLGYAYIDNWTTGLAYTAAQMIVAQRMNIAKFNSTMSYGEYNDDNCNDESWQECEDNYYDYIDSEELKTDIYTLILAIGSIYKFVDLFKKTNQYNKQLHNKIFKKDTKLSYSFLPTSNGAYLNLSYKF